MDAGAHATETAVTVGGMFTVTVADPAWAASWVEVAVTVAVPAAVAVKTPDEVIVPPVAVQTTSELTAPVPCTVAAHRLLCPIRTLAGVQTTATEEITGEADTVTVALPDLVGSCVDVAVIVAVPGAKGVKTPEGVIAPAFTAHVNAGLKDPVPCTVAVQADV
jgi:hypothetical protein